jgi:hypothetical protein
MFLMPVSLDDAAAARATEEAADKQRVRDLQDANRARIAEFRIAEGYALKLYRPAISRLVRDQLDWWCEMGHRFGPSTQATELYDQVMADARREGLA